MSSATEIVAIVVTIMGTGVAAQILADRLQIPSVLFLALGGVVVGPEGLGLVQPDVFGEALPAIVGLSVAIIVFEGAFHLHVERLREAPRETLRLVTVGALLSLVGTAVTVRFVLGTEWDVALLIGSLLVATGPTVITPIMDVVPVRERVATTLETEGVVNDVTAAILALVTFEYVLLGSEGLGTLVSTFSVRLGLGILVGCAVAGLVWYLLNHVSLSVENAPQNARFIVLVAALGAYGLAEIAAAEAGIAGELGSESGIAAVAAAGFVLGNVDLPYRDEMEQFGGDITLLVLSFVFIVLASLLSLNDLAALGLAGVVAVVVIAVVVRPLLVALCTIGDRLTLRERAFVSAIGPRGIIPASVATLFALELRPANPEAASTLVGTVFLVIFVTIVFEGGLARHIAQRLNVIPMRAIIVGGGRVGQALADRLEDRGEEVLLIERDSDAVEALRSDGFTVHEGDGTQSDVLENAGADNAKVVAAATADDDVNLLIGQLARNTFDVETIVARVNNPANEEAFRDLDIEAISSGMSIAWSMDNVIERPAIARWMTELDREGDVQEVAVTDGMVGETVSELRTDLPDDCHLALISRDEHNRLPEPSDTIEAGDHLTIIGRKAAVREALDQYNT